MSAEPQPASGTVVSSAEQAPCSKERRDPERGSWGGRHGHHFADPVEDGVRGRQQAARLQVRRAEYQGMPAESVGQALGQFIPAPRPGCIQRTRPAPPAGMRHHAGLSKSRQASWSCSRGATGLWPWSA
ncbi:hypothetical protein ACFQZC_27700 [Streptacidiphilus monticola]